MFARPSTGPLRFGRTARSRRRLIAACSARSRAVRVRRFWLKGLLRVDATDGYSTTDAGDGNEMPPTNTTERLADYEKRYRELAAQLATIGLIHSGSVTRRYTRCATPGCKCHADPPQPHGPYYQWTTKNNGKTVTRRLNETE